MSGSSPRHTSHGSDVSSPSLASARLASPAPTLKGNCRALLDSCNIFENRKRGFPGDSRELCAQLTTPREGPVTPDSKEVVENWVRTHYYEEDDAIRSLENILGYRGEFEDNESGVKTEKGIYRGRNHSFKKNCVPIPPTKDESLQKFLEAAGLPSTPKPDITYGFTNETFTARELTTIRSIPQLATEKQPWLPYWIVEWKACISGGTIQHAETQARRDGAACVHALFNFFNRVHETEPSAAETAVFTACIDSNVVRIRCHWRRCVADVTSSSFGPHVKQTFITHETGGANAAVANAAGLAADLDTAQTVDMPAIEASNKKLAIPSVTAATPPDSAVATDLSASKSLESETARAGQGTVPSRSQAISYESDVVAQGFLNDESDVYRIRSVIYAILEWTRGERLSKIRKTLRLWGDVCK